MKNKKTLATFLKVFGILICVALIILTFLGCNRWFEIAIFVVGMISIIVGIAIDPQESNYKKPSPS